MAKKRANRDSQSRKEKVVEMLSLPKEVALNMPVVNLEGKSGVYIENYKGILEYHDDAITINTTVGILCVKGKGLSIKSITSEDIIIKGRLGSISFKN